MVGYIGPNGAGKSTTIKMLTGILVPTSGHLRVAGLDPSRARTDLARRIGVVSGQRTSLWWDLPLRDSFELLRKIYRIPDNRYRANLAEFVELINLEDLLDTPVRQLSLGPRMRGDIAASLLHDPEILYLDEPTIGLDVISKGRLREFLRALNTRRGTTLLLTTHDLQDIEALCDRVIVIDHGTLVFDGPLEACRRAAARCALSWSIWWTLPRPSRSLARPPARSMGHVSGCPSPPTCRSTSPPSKTSSATSTPGEGGAGQASGAFRVSRAPWTAPATSIPKPPAERRSCVTGSSWRR
jgi:ABC-type Na+ transport system ATPase subunit NatA